MGEGAGAARRGEVLLEKWAHTQMAGEPIIGGRLGSGAKAATAATATSGVGVVEGETGALHRRDVVDGDSNQVLGAEAVDEQADGVHLQNEVVIEGLLLDVQTVLEARAAPRKDTDPEARRFRRNISFGDELADLFGSLVGQGQL